jgi:hypothetical protein
MKLIFKGVRIFFDQECERVSVRSNKLTQAFSLIECMIYLSCTTMLSLFVFGFASSLYKDVSHARSALHAHLYLQLARDVVKRDLLGASGFLQDYDVEKNIFKKYWIDHAGRRQFAWIGYQVRPKGLARFQGIYDPQGGTWKKKSVSSLPAQIRQLDLSCSLDEVTKQVLRVTMTYHVEEQGRKRILSDQSLIRNRVV